MRIELAWGAVRRWLLKRLRPGYVAAMAARRVGDPAGCPHEVLDPRDLKYHRNQTRCHWPPEHDPFAWRDRLPVARVGLAELVLLGGPLAAAAALLAWLWWPAAPVPAALAAGLVWFFRNPQRTIPEGPGLVVAPADGRVAEVRRIARDERTGEPAVLIGVFLSVLNVHINRAPAAGRVVAVRYRPGKFLNALRPESARENERVDVDLEEPAPPHRLFQVRQIAGAIARRVVCWAAPDELLERGAPFGMIKLGSRTELVLPDEPGLEILVRPGDRVRAGATVVAQYPGPGDASP